MRDKLRKVRGNSDVAEPVSQRQWVMAQCEEDVATTLQKPQIREKERLLLSVVELADTPVLRIGEREFVLVQIQSERLMAYKLCRFYKIDNMEKKTWEQVTEINKQKLIGQSSVSVKRMSVANVRRLNELVSKRLADRLNAARTNQTKPNHARRLLVSGSGITDTCPWLYSSVGRAMDF